jgi:hypothetical protein
LLYTTPSTKINEAFAPRTQTNSSICKIYSQKNQTWAIKRLPAFYTYKQISVYFETVRHFDPTFPYILFKYTLAFMILFSDTSFSVAVPKPQHLDAEAGALS